MNREPADGLRRVLLSSYACHPVEGSEPGVGWQLVLGCLVNGYDVTLVTRENNVEAVRNAVEELGLAARFEAIPFDLAPPLQRLKKRIPFGVQAYYYGWQFGVRTTLRRLVATKKYDIAHHATFAVDWTPVATNAIASSVPTVWGPVGGASSAPRATWRYLGARGLFADAARHALGAPGRRYFGRAAARQSALTIAQNGDEQRAFSGSARSLAVESNAYIDAAALPPRTVPPPGPRVLVGVGRLIPWKGWAIALRVLQQLPSDYELHLYGDGPDRRSLEGLASRWGVAERVTFMGHRSRAEVLEAVASATAFVFTSTHDSSPGAVAEALTIGTPVVGLDNGGVGDLLRSAGRGTVVASNRRGFETDLAQAILAITEEGPTDRFASTRVPGLLTDWYARATSIGVDRGHE